MNGKFYKDVLYHSPVGYAFHEIILDDKGNPCDYRFLEANPTFESLTGLLNKDIIGKTVLEVMPNIVKDKFNWILFYGDIALNNKVETFESFSLPLKRWYKIDAFSPEKFYFVTIFTDISSNKKIEEKLILQNKEKEEQTKKIALINTELQKAQLLLKASLNSPIDIIIVSLDKNYKYLYFNEAHRIIMKSAYNADVEIGKCIFDYITSTDDVIKVKANYDKAMSGISHYTFEQYGNMNGHTFESIFSPIVDDAQQVIGVSVFVRDITEVKQATEKLKENERRFRDLFENAPFGYQSLNETGHFLEVNQKWLEIFGYEKDEVIGKWFGDFLTEDVKNSFDKRFEMFKANGTAHSEFLMKTKNGKQIQVVFDGKIGYNQNHEFAQTHCIINDITEINIAMDKLKESEMRYRELIENLEAAIIIHGRDTSIISANRRAEKLLGLPLDELLGKKADYEKFDFIDTDYHKLKVESYPLNLIIKNKLGLKHYILGVRHSKNHEIVWVSVNGVPIFNEDQSIREIVISLTDISSEKIKQDEIIFLGNHDSLTGLYNRRFFRESYHKFNQEAQHSIGIMMLDVNGLKIINDAYGHHTGDIVLKKVADILNMSCRKNDVICRVGGDEFAIVLPNIQLDQLDEIKQIIKQNAKNQIINNVPLSLAIGYSLKSELEQDDLDKILKSAENNMYRHKLTEGVSMRNNSIKAILETLTDKYEEERIHSKKVSKLCKKMGEVLDLKEDDIKELEQAGMYHDIGKISIPDAILNKPGRLTKEEYEVIKTHPEISYQILRAADEYSDLAIHALYHHERWDGKGYPSGKKGLDIPMFSRIIGIIDAYEAMTAVRVYKDKMTENQAINEIIRCSGSQFDERLAKIFVKRVLGKNWEIVG